MRRKILILLCLVSLAAGCGVYMSPQYRAETERMNIRLAELDRRCQGGDPNACSDGLRIASVHVRRICDAMAGREGE